MWGGRAVAYSVQQAWERQQAASCIVLQTQPAGISATPKGQMYVNRTEEAGRSLQSLRFCSVRAECTGIAGT
jgi:hypothetical protein